MRVVALAGGVGGAKIADGLASILPPDNLTVIVNTGDDFEHFGLTICPDLDTVTYTLGGLANPETGWGRADESWNFMSALGNLGGPTWFRLGDRDLALHAERTRRLRRGQSLVEVTRHVCQVFGIAVQVLPMSNQPIRTIVLTEEGEMPFQEYFVARGCSPRVTGFRFVGSEVAKPAPGIIEAIAAADIIILCPSNPWVSLDPILAVPGIREAAEWKPVVGVSPLVGGKAIKGPAAKMCSELGFDPNVLTIAKHFRGLLAGLVIDVVDEALAADIESMGIRSLVTDTVMKGVRDRARLAQEVLAFGSEGISIEVKS
jgi:LPPG:FO 2-phospho-L-lactate transferase